MKNGTKCQNFPVHTSSSRHSQDDDSQKEKEKKKKRIKQEYVFFLENILLFFKICSLKISLEFTKNELK